MGERRWTRAALVVASVLLSLSGGPDPARAAPRGTPGVTAALIANIQVSHDRFPDHAEPALAVNPRDPRNLLGAAMYFTQSPTPGTFASFDGGRTWRDNGALPLPAGASGGADVSAAFNAAGIGFVAAGSATPDPTGRGVSVWRTDDGGRSFQRPVAVASHQFVDHPWLASDPTPGPAGGALYVAWVTRHAAGQGPREGVAFSRSGDGGRSFTRPRLISVPPGGVTAPVVAAGPGGAVYVAYVTATSGPTPTLVVELVASRDHGRRFGPPVALGPTVFGLTPQPNLTLPSGPMVATDPHDGTVYVVYTAMRPGAVGGAAAAIVLARSRDSGRTWTTAALVTATSPRDQAVAFQPQVAVNAAGTVALSYLSLTRGRVAVMLAQSVTHGARFTPAQRITTRSFDPALGLPGDKEGLWWIGDYQGLAAGPRSLYPCWGDTRTGHLHIFSAAVPAAA